MQLLMYHYFFLYFCILNMTMEIITSKDIISAQDAINRSKRIAIVSHYNPDGDAVGASLALYHFFKNRNISVQVILPNPYPDFLEWMSGSDQILVAEDDMRSAHRFIKEADLLFVVDMNAAHRSGNALEDRKSVV